MKHYLLSYKKWNILESKKIYIIDSRPNYEYSIYEPYWKYSKIGTQDWNYVENEESVYNLNKKYDKDLGVYKPKGYSKYTIEGRDSYHYKVSPNKKYWQYQKIGTDSWKNVENKNSVSKLNNKYKLKLSIYKIEYVLIFKDWKNRGLSAAKYLLKKGSSIGMTKTLSAAFIGNFKVESGVRHDSSQKYSKGIKLGWGYRPVNLKEAKNTHESWGYGLAHWTRDRRERLIDNGADTINKQLDFVISELKGSHKKAWKNIKSSKDVKTATQRIVKQYEVSGVDNLDDRLNAADEILKLL